jgi:succinate dehydrogenase/fumarate reductase flavoprotein subunit
MLQVPVMPPDYYRNMTFWGGMQVPHFREMEMCHGGLVVDWDMRTNLEGLYGASNGIFGLGEHSTAATSGRYAGRKAAVYARTATEPVLDRKQVEEERIRVYLPLKQGAGNIGWKELNAGISRVMQDYCGQYKNEETLKAGLQTLKELRESEAAKACAANPHELGRILECQALITSGEMVMKSCLTRKASNDVLDFHRLDYPEMDPAEWQKFIFIKEEGNKIRTRELPLDYYLNPPYAPTFEENYRLHCGL